MRGPVTSGRRFRSQVRYLCGRMYHRAPNPQVAGSSPRFATLRLKVESARSRRSQVRISVAHINLVVKDSRPQVGSSQVRDLGR